MISDNRDTIVVHEARVIQQRAYEDEQYILRLSIPEDIPALRPGQFIYIQCSSRLPMRRPYSILEVSSESWLEIYYRVVGTGSEMLATAEVGDTLSCMVPIGNGFTLQQQYRKPLLLGGGVGIPPILFLADQLAESSRQWDPLVLLASERTLPFPVCKSRQVLPYTQASATLVRLEEKGITARLCSQQNYPDFFKGRIDDLAEIYLAEIDDETRSQLEIFACGPAGMLETIAKLAKRYKIPCQVCVEEYMACAVGGCAGCTIKIIENGNIVMKRVCVDGPVFSAESIYVDQ